ncbi:MAG: hypothetical protein KF862_00525 [Chitinophagaceae bacterium]|nr:hypothetical protein [Chitinophagaceae bacterium]
MNTPVRLNTVKGTIARKKIILYFNSNRIINQHMGDADNKLKAIELLSDWSKWLIGINFGAATGCTVVLKTGVSEKVSPLLFAAILLFICSLVVATLLTLVLTTALHKNSGISKMHQFLAWLQLVLFFIAIVFLLTWVWKLKELQGKTPAKATTSAIAGSNTVRHNVFNK